VVPRLAIFEPAVAQPKDVIKPIQNHLVMGDDDDRNMTSAPVVTA
jgi:hypothetical protein